VIVARICLMRKPKKWSTHSVGFAQGNTIPNALEKLPDSFAKLANEKHKKNASGWLAM